MNNLEKFKEVQTEGFNLFKKKNEDYGDSYKEYGCIGILIRMNDKVNRSISVSKNNISLLKSESLRDTLIDLQNYATMAIMEMDCEADKPMISSSNHYSNSL